MIDLRVGDCREVLATLPPKSVQCCVTSPPYFGLRDYGVDGQMGLEPTLAEYITGMVDVFRLVRDVLADDGTLWLNIGDSYCSTPAGNTDATFSAKQASNAGSEVRRSRSTLGNGMKPKDLMMVPARLAIALQDDGWYLRSDIIWHKPNPMPESVQDRPTSAHEHIFLLTKSARYYYDADAIAEPAQYVGLTNQDPSGFKNPETFNGKHKDGYRSTKQDQVGNRTYTGFNDRYSEKEPFTTRNCRNVWSIATHPFPGAHFATFPPEIPRRCILAGSREGDTILDPFAGAGTTLLVADRLGRNGVGVELNPEYAQLAKTRIYNDAPMFAGVQQ